MICFFSFSKLSAAIHQPVMIWSLGIVQNKEQLGVNEGKKKIKYSFEKRGNVYSDIK